MSFEEAKKKHNEEIDFVQMLRSKTEESDLKQVLRSSIGGYTKQSVMDYLAIMRKNQQSMAETFYENQQLLYVEKEKLRKDNEKLKNKLAELDSKYLDLTVQVSPSNVSPSDGKELEGDALLLKQQVVSLELEIQEGVALLESLSSENEELKAKLALANQESETRKTLILSNDTESQKQKNRTDDLTAKLDEVSLTLQNERVKWEAERTAFETEKLKYEEKLLLSKQNTANADLQQRSTQDIDLMMRVNELTEQLSLQTELVASENTERTIREETIRSLTAQIEALKTDSATFKTTIENLTLQNEKLLLSNSTMCTRMEEECRRTTALINEKSDVFIEKLMAMKKLSEAETRISMLEMELNNGGAK